jgi:hypothetical protein
MSTYVLIHGSSIGGWSWNKVKKLLENSGHVVYTPDLPGHSMEPRVPAREITLDTYVSFVRNLINGIDEKVILAGHSLGGAIITNVAEYAHDRINKLVYVCAIVPKNGDKAGELLKSDAGSETKSTITINKIKMHIELNIDKIDEVLFNGCEKDDIAYAKKRLVPQPFIPFTESIIIKQENFKKVDRVGVVCTEDRSLSPSFQVKMYKDAGCRTVFLKSGHAPYFSKAEELTKILSACS